MVMFNKTLNFCNNSKKLNELGYVLKAANGVKCDGGKEVNLIDAKNLNNYFFFHS